ncbi:MULTISPECIES: Gfo/Idh/MocA family oxidoreductase [Chryseobacterium]|jgi:predicted dehydrogenase|uniref:Oxidoreductase n=1 Tax=Chryseobacterium rhizosphaerae TaxID=395937 RepID=A0ABX9IF82_9FLAO|nr:MULTISPECIES: Gfo/Idh/MocA family oxidoreductase [Chryseobacterium]MBL3549256.1 Gfo/Idh/MocA family oxidoreductase [Chryseobacterium sp. KMC2]REC71638.1 oxidoreductase [Chryseobacterium rhizosphaerae]GEN68141.1 oxidoreductase [Chryseobacterium rhizosphaerae]
MQLVKAGLCAFGMSGKVFHAPFLKEHPGFFISAVVERSKEESKEKYPEATIYRSVEEMLQSADIELVVINTPVQTHYEYAKKALEAGKNIIVEKPFTVNVEEAEELVKLAEEKGLFLSVYQNRRFDRDFLQVKKILEEGKLGSIKEAEIRFDRFRTTPSGKQHKENPDQIGSGSLHDLGAHLVDQAVLCFGYPEKLFADVFSMKGTAFANDYFEILLFYKNDVRVRLKSSVFSKEAHNAYIIHGDKGSFLQERTDNQENELVAGAIPVYGNEWMQGLKQPDGILNFLNENSETERILTSSEAGNYMDYYQQIYEHIVFGYPLPSPGREVIQNMKIIDASLKSTKEEKVIYL